jgi:hypothetical protein
MKRGSGFTSFALAVRQRVCERSSVVGSMGLLCRAVLLLGQKHSVTRQYPHFHSQRVATRATACCSCVFTFTVRKGACAYRATTSSVPFNAVTSVLAQNYL